MGRAGANRVPRKSEQVNFKIAGCEARRDLRPLVVAANGADTRGSANTGQKHPALGGTIPEPRTILMQVLVRRTGETCSQR